MDCWGWQCIVFSAESRFCLEAHNGRVRVWQSVGEHLSLAFIVEWNTAPTSSVMVWAAIAYNTKTPLVVMCTLTAQ